MSAQPDTAAAPDPGLYGPDSVTWRVHADPSMVLGGFRALLLQALHPFAMHGVLSHSDFKDDPWGRFFRTGEYVGVTTFGTTDEARRAGARVRGIHRKLAGVEPVTGTAYRVDDPELLRWVHCVEVESFLSTAVRCGLRLSPAEQDQYYAEQVRGAELVGLDPVTIPSSVAQMAAYYRDVRPQLRVTPGAREVVRFGLWPPMPLLVQVGDAGPADLGVAGDDLHRHAAALGPADVLAARAADHRRRRDRGRHRRPHRPARRARGAARRPPPQAGPRPPGRNPVAPAT